MIPLEKVELIVKKYETLEKELASGDIDKKNFVNKSKEYASIGEVINQAKAYIGFQKEKEELSIHGTITPMLNQNQMRIGVIVPWIDKKNEFPAEFKDDNNVIMPMGIQGYEYIMDTDSIFHEMPKRVYHKYRFIQSLKRFVLTNEITTISK